MKKRVQRFLHSGNLGDIVWSLPFVIAKGGGDMYIRNHNPMSATNMNYKSIFRLLISQPYIRKVVEYPIDFAKKELYMDGPHIGRIKEGKIKYDPKTELDYDLDFFRMSPGLHQEHLISAYFRAFNTEPKQVPFPYLLIKEDFDFKNENLNKRIEIPKESYNAFHITHRYRDEYDWGKLIKEQDKPNYFVGLKEEYDDLQKHYDIKDHLIFYGDKITDMYDMALMLKGADMFYCNPSVGNGLAVAMHIRFAIKIPEGMQLVETGMPNETILY